MRIRTSCRWVRSNTPAQIFYILECACLLLKHANGGNARGASVDAGSGIGERDSANRYSGDRQSAADLCKALHALGCAEGRLRGRSENRAKENVVGAVAFGGQCGFE